MRDAATRQLDAYGSDLALELLDACQVMARHAAAHGLGIPDWVGNAVSKMGATASGLEADVAAAEEAGDGARAAELTDELRREVAKDLRGLTRIHGVLAEVVAPTTPRSIRATRGADTFRGAIRSIPLAGAMLAVGMLFLVGYVACSTVVADGGAGGWAAVCRHLGLLCAAGLGAAFWSLFTIHRYIVAGTYDPRYTIVYWTRLGLGLIAGGILGEVVFTQLDPDPAAAGAGTVLTTSMVALLGGYSADAVNRILRRLVEMMVTLVRGDTSRVVEQLEAEHRIRLHEQLSRERLATAARLLELRTTLGAALSPEAEKALAELAEQVLADMPEPAPPAPRG